MRHFTDIELHRWRESGPGDDRQRVVAHLAECADCASRYAAAIRARPLRAEPASDVEDFAAAGRRTAGKRTWMIPLAAAAVLVLAVAIPLAMRRNEPELRFRGSGIQTFAPAGDVDRGVEFVWSSSITASRFRIEISDANGVIYTTETDHSRLAMPTGLRTGIEYWWRVTALDAQGRPLTTSARRAFTIQR